MRSGESYHYRRLRDRVRAKIRKADRAKQPKCCASVAARRCSRFGKVRVADKWFCRQHAPIWKTHYQIVERIRSIPNRDAVY